MDLFYIFNVVSQFNFTNDIEKSMQYFFVVFLFICSEALLIVLSCVFGFIVFFSIACTLRQKKTFIHFIMLQNAPYGIKRSLQQQFHRMTPNVAL